MIESIISAIAPGLIVGIVLAVWERRQKRRDRQAQTAEGQRIRSESLRVSLLVAAAKLSYATAVALRDGHCNGEVADGIEQYKAAMRQFKEFERELVANQSLGT